MSRRVDLTLGERLGIGFAVMMLGLGLFTGAVLYWGAQSARAQRVYLENIAPLHAQAEALERSMLYVAIGMRDFVLYPKPTSAEHLRERLDGMRGQLARLESMPKPAQGLEQLAQIKTRVVAYTDATAAVLAEAGSQQALMTHARSLGDMREATLVDIRRYVAALQRESEDAVATMTAARERVAIGSLVMVALAALFGLGAAWLMTRAVRRPLRELTDVAGALGRGDWQPALRLAARLSPSGVADAAPRSETGTLARAFATAAIQIEGRERQLRARAAVSASISSSIDKAQLANRALQLIIDHIHAEVGVIYWYAADARLLQPLASCALDDSLPALAPGEGIPGEAARTRRTVIVRDLPRDSAFSVKLGYDQAPPRCVAAVPIEFKDSLHGVLLVASLRDLAAETVSFLEPVARELGIALQNAASYEEAQRLLAQLSQSSQRIQTQNEQLQAQAEEIQAQNEELQAQSEEIQAQNEELRSHADALAEVDEHKNQFLGVLAHELRNPMAPITLSLEILQRTAPGSERALQAQAVIARQTRQLIRLIDDLLDVTRISQGKVRLDRRPMDLVEIARACAQDQAPILAERALAFDVDLPASPVWVHGDRERLAQVIGNLITNAVKFTDAGGRVRLDIREDRANGHVLLMVADTGIGMDARLISRLFQPFSQGPTGLARTNAGLGLGLALVKSLVSLHEGTVEAHSDGPGTGSRFVVRLPLGTAAPAAAAPATAPHDGTSAATAAPSPATWRVLVIDDYVDAAMGLRALLRLDGHTVEVAADGTAGLDKARAFRPHLVLCDIGLPVMDGYEVARHLRGEDTGAAALLVALTGYASEVDKARCVAAGFDRHLAKPLHPDQLTELYEELARRYA